MLQQIRCWGGSGGGGVDGSGGVGGREGREEEGRGVVLDLPNVMNFRKRTPDIGALHCIFAYFTYSFFEFIYLSVFHVLDFLIGLNFISCDFFLLFYFFSFTRGARSSHTQRRALESSTAKKKDGGRTTFLYVTSLSFHFTLISLLFSSHLKSNLFNFALM